MIWEGTFSGIRVDTKDINVQSKVSQLFIDGYTAYLREESKNVAHIISEMNAEIADASNKLLTQGITVCKGISFASRAPSQDDIDISRVLVLELQTSLALMNGANDDEVENLFGSSY